MYKALMSIATWLVATPAFAHHPLDGKPLETFAHGLFSGVGHPILGYDHLLFIVLVGIAAVFTAHRLLSPLAYIVAMLCGCLIAAAGNVLPASELMVAVSLLMLGGIMLTGYQLHAGATVSIFILFGLFHGSAFGSFLAEQESAAGLAVLIGYLVGLGFIQYGLALVAGWICRKGWKAEQPGAIQPRLAAAVIAGAGLLLTLESIGAR
jgi:urease accessory protein